MKDFIEVKVGEIVKIDGESYICVKDRSRSTCSKCAFRDNDCYDYACCNWERSDKTDVHFIKQEGGEE